MTDKQKKKIDKVRIPNMYAKYELAFGWETFCYVAVSSKELVAAAEKGTTAVVEVNPADCNPDSAV